jgi:hypothetical protein
MNDERPTDLLSSLPRTRPHRRSEKRGAPADGQKHATPEGSPPAAKSGGAESARAKAGGAKAAGAKAAGAKAAAKSAAARPRRGASTAQGQRKPRPRASTKPLKQPAQPRGIPSARRAAKRKPAPATGAEIVGTAVQAVGELAEIGVALGTRALRNALGRLPRP